jgi:DNA transformation protein
MSDFVNFVLERLTPLGHMHARAMFGGYGIYSGDTIFAIIVQDVLYLKTDDVTREHFIARGLRPFTYAKQNKTVAVMKYYEAPSEIFEENEAMQSWVKPAINMAQKTKIIKKSRRRG